jgi:prepilin-type N-terminal cleavage/methylation domain-containing protein
MICKGQEHQRGFSFFELMITVAVVGLLSAVAIPAYKGYIDTANMTKVTAVFEESVRVSVNTFARRKTKIALGIIENVPDKTEDWITLLNPNNLQAPGGGPAFIPSSDLSRGDEITGAIGVKWTSAKSKKSKGKGIGKGSSAKKGQLQLWRPLYRTLEGYSVVITEDDTQVAKYK